MDTGTPNQYFSEAQTEEARKDNSDKEENLILQLESLLKTHREAERQGLERVTLARNERSTDGCGKVKDKEPKKEKTSSQGPRKKREEKKNQTVTRFDKNTDK